MTDEKKKEFTRRLTQCNASEMIVIQYEIFFTYLDDALEAYELGGEPYRDGSYDYYVHETVCSGDTKGTAPFLMACCALEV